MHPGAPVRRDPNDGIVLDRIPLGRRPFREYVLTDHTNLGLFRLGRLVLVERDKHGLPLAVGSEQDNRVGGRDTHERFARVVLAKQPLMWDIENGPHDAL